MTTTRSIIKSSKTKPKVKARRKVLSPDVRKTLKLTEVSADDLAKKYLKQNPDGSSYAVCFIRVKNLQTDGSVKASKRNPGWRRFRTPDEAHHHGARFVMVQGHQGYWISKRTEAVNSWVNWDTGMSNPELTESAQPAIVAADAPAAPVMSASSATASPAT